MEGDRVCGDGTIIIHELEEKRRPRVHVMQDEVTRFLVSCSITLNRKTPLCCGATNKHSEPPLDAQRPPSQWWPWWRVAPHNPRGRRGLGSVGQFVHTLPLIDLIKEKPSPRQSLVVFKVLLNFLEHFFYMNTRVNCS